MPKIEKATQVKCACHGWAFRGGDAVRSHVALDRLARREFMQRVQDWAAGHKRNFPASNIKDFWERERAIGKRSLEGDL